MIDFEKIPYHDLRAENERGILPKLVGRKEELQRLSRVLGRRMNNNCFIVGPSGIGKTAFVYGWFERACRNEANGKQALVQFDAGHLQKLGTADDAYYEQALKTLPASVIFIDDFGRVMYNNNAMTQRLTRLYGTFLKRPDVQVIATLQPQEYAWLSEEYPAFARLFEVITLKTQVPAEYVRILEASLTRLNQSYKIVAPASILRSIVEYAEQFPSLGVLPRAAISLLDECLACAASSGVKMITDDIVQTVVSGKTGVPLSKLQSNEISALNELESELNAQIVNQKDGIGKIASIITRAKLGIKNPNKPLSSFLLLGPSGVGKTETAKLVAEKVFGRAENFVRLDMSEFGQEHTVQRLIGAPPGYIGYDSGGGLTEILKAEPHSLLLLDEIEKAHPKVFDIFLQVLDDGRLTSGQNETVSAKHAIIMATSNIGVREIVAGFEEGADIHSAKFLKEKILPALTAHFRLEFINRFDSILVFNPLKLPDLIKI
ncbi:MAG TPA: AAA family ATPase, partial [Candidatus Paceibacterota bacterium]|nr:AAA family ATPase [Candidatus Paceibacterota bacterium]